MNFNAYSEQKQVISDITLVSCGHIFAKNGREIKRPLGRADWLLFYVVKGSETFYLNNTEINAKAGSFIIFAPNEAQHHITKTDRNAEFYYIHFKCDELPTEVSFHTSEIYSTEPSRKICDTFEEIIDEVLRKEPCYEQFCIYRLLSLLTILKRSLIRENHPQKINFERISRAISHINRYYNENLSLEDYAKLCNMSKHHFLRVFERITGSTPIEYRNNIRLEHAAELLLDKYLSVEEIGTLMGYSSPSYFSSAFKNKFGLSPKQYQQVHLSLKTGERPL